MQITDTALFLCDGFFPLLCVHFHNHLSVLLVVRVDGLGFFEFFQLFFPPPVREVDLALEHQPRMKAQVLNLPAVKVAVAAEIPRPR